MHENAYLIFQVKIKVLVYISARNSMLHAAGVLTDRGRNSDAQPFGKMQMIQGTIGWFLIL